MQTSHFSDGKTASFSIERKHRVVELYDSSLLFNRIVEEKQGDPQSIVYSINSELFLKELAADNLPALFKITLACRQTRTGTSMWDALFNDAQRQAMTSCIFIAQNNYQPIPQDRVMYTSQFLNFTMPVTRSHLNHIITGDRIGIAINDINSNRVYILLYLVEDFGMTTKNNQGEETAFFVSAVNVKLEHALLLNGIEQPICLSMEEDNEFNTEKAMPFVERLIDTVDNISEGFPWKPHFIPFIPREYKRKELEERILQQQKVALDTSFDDFEMVCKKAYRRIRDQRRPNTRLRPGARDNHARGNDNRDNKPYTPKPPVVEVVSLQDHYLISFVLGNRDNGTTYKVPSSDLNKHAWVENFFTNKDLEHVIVGESSKVFVLSPDPFGDNAFVRYFSLSF